MIKSVLEDDSSAILVLLFFVTIEEYAAYGPFNIALTVVFMFVAAGFIFFSKYALYCSVGPYIVV